MSTATIRPPRRLAGDFLRSSHQAGIAPPVKIEQTRDALELLAKRAITDRTVIRQPFLRSTIREAAVNGDGTPKPLEGTINASEVDRYQSIIDPGGIDFTAFRANPIMLWQHGLDFAGSWPVGRVLEISRTDGMVEVKWEFDVDGDLGKELDRLYRQKWLRGLSIGFIPSAYDFIMLDGRSVIRYTACELAELSCVAVPGNSSCLSRTLSAESQRRLVDLTTRAGAMFSKANRETIQAHCRDLEDHCDSMRDMASNLRALVADGEDTGLEAIAAAAAAKSNDLSGDGGDTTIKPGRSAQVWVCDPLDKFPVEWRDPFDLYAEAQAAGANARLLRAMATASTRQAGHESHLLLHHHADGRVSWRALAACMARLLTQPTGLTNAEKEAAYSHLAGHYRALAIVPPEAGARTPDQAYNLVLEGRIAHIDEAGDAWLFARAIDECGTVRPQFEKVDDGRRRTFPKPARGRQADPAQWGRGRNN